MGHEGGKNAEFMKKGQKQILMSFRPLRSETPHLPLVNGEQSENDVRGQSLSVTSKNANDFFESGILFRTEDFFLVGFFERQEA